MTVEAGGEVAGYVAVFRRNGKSEIAYWLGRKHWRKGIGQSAVSAFLKRYKDRPVFGAVAIRNVASLAILRRCGFTIVAKEIGPDGSPEHVLRLG